MPEASTETLVRALGSIVADFRREIARDLEAARSVMLAEAKAGIAEAEARREGILYDALKKIDERLAQVRDGSDGADGADGRDGNDGKDGKDGAQGEPGQDGQDGRDGNDGKDGADGAQGEQGVAGEPGAPGIDGEAGKDGADGRDGEKGEPGQDGRSAKACGLFDPERDYAELDIVALNGGSFIALKDSPGLCPGGGWQLLASKGSRGERGERGLPGRDGVPGQKGDRGPAGEGVAAFYVDGADIVLTMDSGREMRAAFPKVNR